MSARGPVTTLARRHPAGITSVDGAGVDVRKYSGVVMVAAEQPYAEMKGDVVFPATLRHTARYPEDLKALKRVSGKGVPVVTVLYSGRPVPVNDLLNRSDAFVAAWLPGTEGQWALVDSIRFPMDPDGLVLENNEICFHFKSDFRSHIENVISALFRPGAQELNGLSAEDAYVGDMLTLTSLRHGFAHRRSEEAFLFEAHQGSVNRAERDPARRDFFYIQLNGHRIRVVPECPDREQRELFKLAEAFTFHGSP